METPVYCLSDILITAELDRRPVRPHDSELSHGSLRLVSDAMISGRTALLQATSDMALDLTQGTTTGISVIHERPAGAAMVWEAVSGINIDILHGELPRFNSPCGYTIDQKALHLFSDPGRYYTYMPAFNPPMFELLAVPMFTRHRKPWGTLWVFVQDAQTQLDREDAEQLSTLVDFTMAALDLQQRSARGH